MLSAYLPPGADSPHERRRHPRSIRAGSVWVTRERLADPDFRVPLVDLSLGGAFFRSPILPERGESVWLRIVFAGGPVITARARVSRTARSGFACSFDDMDDTDFFSLRYWLTLGGSDSLSDALGD